MPSSMMENVTKVANLIFTTAQRGIVFSISNLKKQKFRKPLQLNAGRLQTTFEHRLSINNVHVYT